MRKDKIFREYKKCILHHAYLKYPEFRKRRYSLEYYLNNFTHVLNDVTKWEVLSLINRNEHNYHWKSIYNEFRKWSNDNIFEVAFTSFLRENYFKLSQVRKNKKMNMFIDVTKINNKYGSENVAINVEYKKKNVTELTVICDESKIPLAVKPVEINKTLRNYKTFKHETCNVQKTLDKIPFKLKDYVSVKLIGDKGYISKKKFKVFGNKINIITPKRKNQKIKNTKLEKIYLHKRHKVENFFVSFKKYERVNIRKDRKINTYLSFVYMSLLKYLISMNV